MWGFSLQTLTMLGYISCSLILRAETFPSLHFGLCYGFRVPFSCQHVCCSAVRVSLSFLANFPDLLSKAGKYCPSTCGLCAWFLAHCKMPPWPYLWYQQILWSLHPMNFLGCLCLRDQSGHVCPSWSKMYSEHWIWNSKTVPQMVSSRRLMSQFSPQTLQIKNFPAMIASPVISCLLSNLHYCRWCWSSDMSWLHSCKFGLDLG